MAAILGLGCPELDRALHHLCLSHNASRVPLPYSVTCPIQESSSAIAPFSGRSEEVSDGAQEQRRESGEVPGGAEEASAKEPGQQEPIQVQRQGDAGELGYMDSGGHGRG